MLKAFKGICGSLNPSVSSKIIAGQAGEITSHNNVDEATYVLGICQSHTSLEYFNALVREDNALLFSTVFHQFGRLLLTSYAKEKLD